MRDVRGGALLLRDMQYLFVEANVGYVLEMEIESRKVVEELYLEIGSRLNEFDFVVSQYGCSICGELFREVDLGDLE